MTFQWIEICPPTDTQNQLSETFQMEVVLSSSNTQATKDSTFFELHEK